MTGHDGRERCGGEMTDIMSVQNVKSLAIIRLKVC